MWKIIEEFPRYMVNKDGVVMNDKNKVLSQYTDRYGYKVTTLYNINKKRKKITTHCLVMEAFQMKRPFGMQINHIDGNKKNNSIENLEYVTPGDNLKHAYANGFKNAVGENNGKSKLTENKVIEIKLMLKKRVSQSKISKLFKIDQSTVSNINTGKLWSHV